MNELLKKYDKWTKDFMDSWKDLDWRKTLELLSKDVKYYEFQKKKIQNYFL